MRAKMSTRIKGKKNDAAKRPVKSMPSNAPANGAASKKSGKFQHACAVKPAGTYSSPSSLAIPPRRRALGPAIKNSESTLTDTGKQDRKASNLSSKPKSVMPHRKDDSNAKEDSGSILFDENRQPSSDFSIYEDPISKEGAKHVQATARSPAPPSSPPFKTQEPYNNSTYDPQGFASDIWLGNNAPDPSRRLEDWLCSPDSEYSMSSLDHQSPATVKEGLHLPSETVYRIPTGVNTIDINGRIINLDAIPRPLAVFDDEWVDRIYNQLNFDYQSQLDPVLEVTDVFLPRDINFDKVLKKHRDEWFVAPTTCEPQALRQTWNHCAQDDARVIRDLYCAYNLTIHHVLEKAKSVKFTKSGGGALSGWSDVWVDPCDFITDFCTNLQCDDRDVDRIWNDYGIDLFRFIETQYTLRTAVYSFKPGAIEVKSGICNEGRNMYLLTCLRLPNGKFKLRQYPPQLLTTSSLSPQQPGHELKIMPDMWHPHLSVSKGHSPPAYHIVGDASWLCWKPELNCFQGTVPNRRELNPYTKIDEQNRICIYMVGEYSLGVGSCNVELHEVVTSRIYIQLPETRDILYEAENEAYYPPNPLDLLWNSQRLGFDRKHSDFVARQTRLCERRLLTNFNEENARLFANLNSCKLQVRDTGPFLISHGPISWYDFLKWQMSRCEYLMCKYDDDGRENLVWYIRTGKRVHFEEDNYAIEKESAEVDTALEEMRDCYQNLFDEARMLVWLDTIYREDMQERMEDEAFDDF